MKRLQSFLFVLALVLAGCAGKPFDPATQNPEKLMDARVMPTQDELNNPSVHTAVFNPRVRIPDAIRANVDDIIRDGLADRIQSSEAVLVDGAVPTELRRDVSTVQQGGEAHYRGPNVADYAIKGTITHATMQSNYEEESYREDETDGTIQMLYTPPACRYNARVRTRIDIYQVPKLNRVGSFEQSGKYSQYNKLTRGQGPGSCERFKASVLTQAAEQAVYKHDKEIESFLRPYGYVLERVDNNGTTYFKVSLGSNRGLRANQTVRIIRITPADGVGSTSQQTVLTGTVYSVDHRTAWIHPDSPRKADRVRRGHRVYPVEKPDNPEESGFPWIL